MNRSNSAGLHEASFACPDYERECRKGVPEIILTDTKTVSQSLAIATSFLEHNGRAILSRVSSDLRDALEAEYGTKGFDWYASSRMAVLHAEGFEIAANGGRVGIISAGTSDQPAAQEAAVVCREMGCDVHVVHDVGVAGLHRLFEPLERLLDKEDVDVIIVAAGMDGALPSVVSGLVDVPVLGLPTSVGYGMGGKGESALLAMLQTCSPGLAVVNIDNGVGAGVMAALIADRVASARSGADGRSQKGG
ncbi:MAG: nickel pincer cofactor biosynthesis protein LarB [Anaerolineales bacterium]